MTILDNYKKSRYYRVKNQKIIYCIWCHECEKHVFKTKQPEQSNDLEHGCGGQTELLPWWVVKQEMDQNLELQDEYSKALYS